MRKINITIIVIMTILNLLSLKDIKGYWEKVTVTTSMIQNQIEAGDWLDYTWDSDFNLDIWEEEDDLNHNLPSNQIFTYKGRHYITTDNSIYNPKHHGVPGPKSLWAFYSLDFDWAPNSRYEIRAVVIRNGRYFIANQSWVIDDPLVNNGLYKQWREIQPVSQEMFKFIPNTILRDYTSLSPSQIIYK